MNNIDDQIRSALDKEADKALLEFKRNESFFGLIREVMHATSMRISIFVYCIMLVQTAFAVFFAIRFFRSESTQTQIAWAVGFGIAFMGIGMLKLWIYLLANRNVILREVKRLELQVAKLAEQSK